MKDIKNQRFASSAVLRAAASSVAMVVLCSCNSAVYDMRKLDQPVILNDNPFLAAPIVMPPKLVKVDAYSAEVKNSEAMTDNQNTTTQNINTAQLNAFLEIGGEPNYFIRNVSLDASGGEANLLFLLVTGADLEATGEVTEIKGPVLGRTGAQNQLPPTNPPESNRLGSR